MIVSFKIQDNVSTEYRDQSTEVEHKKNIIGRSKNFINI